LRIYKIATIKKAKLSDFFGTPQERLEEFAKKFVKDFFNKSDTLPTVGDVILGMMREMSSDTKGVGQEFLKMIASSVIAQMQNSLLKT
jgi:hypothetical protein